MKPLPMPLRIAAGLVATAIEEVQGFPRKLVELPVTAVSQALQASMRMQQRVTELAIKGDRVLGGLRSVPETPAWARFDEDELELQYGASNGLADSVDETAAATADWNVPPPRRAPRTVSPIHITRQPEPAVPEPASQPTAPAATATTTPVASAGPAGDGSGPEGLEDYDTWTLPQLRGRFRVLSLEQVQALLAWETSHRDRPPYVTMLSNRVASITGR